MGKYSIAFGLAGLLALNLSTFAHSQQEKQSGNRRIAMALPKAPAQAVPVPVIKVQTGKQAVFTPLSTTRVIDPELEFASHPRIAPANSTGKQTPDNLRAMFIDGAAMAEQLSRSYNRRIADAIVWLANSMNQSTSMTPAISPNLHRQKLIMPQQSIIRSEHGMLQID